MTLWARCTQSVRAGVQEGEDGPDRRACFSQTAEPLSISLDHLFSSLEAPMLSRAPPGRLNTL